MLIHQTLKAKWFWYSVVCILFAGAFAIASKLGSKEIPASTMQFLFNLGSVPVGMGLVAARRFKLEKHLKGIAHGIASGVLGAFGTLGLFAAFRSGGNTAVITVTTGLYPMVTVVLAVVFLRERLTALQVVGLGFAGVALVILSL